MTRTKRVSRGRRRLGLATAGLATVLLTGLPVASASAAPHASGAVMIESGPFHGFVLCASPNDESVWLKQINTADAYCKWKVFGSSSEFTLYNAAKDQVMAYTGGNEGAVVMEDEGTSPLGAHGELWSWGGAEDWGASALQSFYDSGQNVDAGIDSPRTDPVHTRGWRHGHQRELTWNAITAG
ncbi:hypothetical protein EDD90_6880 [Streptomyces sp. Ag109_O5-1]|uniref:hypothetical protein n=1 Tax=Streptomyces sp. Ag109_O5-1 TaxID=1938851 RepID=UPI000F50AB4D|nr:hypothetical protein [Streptomyces sp. Ag109_O5-1]RPE43669.1 hypothetical protein EDD90_6880 [Streptomyces sp. Ag109_O5-1]